MKNNKGFSSPVASSVMALVAAAAVAAVFVIAPLSVTGQDAPDAPAKGGGKGGFGGKGGGKQAVPAGPVPRTAEGKPDLSGFWGGVQPGGVTSIEPAAARGGGGGRGAGKGGPPGGGPPGGGPGGPEQDLVDLLAEGLLEADLALQADPVAPVEVLAAEVPVVRAAAAARTPSSIPRMAKFPTPSQRARNPTT